jgi:ornithine cyclodeaminase/alanine dehydrogenase-like protein (mu-crystallin family)
MLILANEEIEQIISMELCVEALGDLYAQLAEGQAVDSPRGDIFVPLELYQLSDLAGHKVQGRSSPEEITCFMNNVGIGLQFAAVGARLFQLARRRGLGHEIPTDWFLQSVHP